MITLITIIFVGFLLGFSSYFTFTKLPIKVQKFLYRYPLVWDLIITISNLLFVTSISMSFMAVGAAVVSEMVALGLFRWSAK